MSRYDWGRPEMLPYVPEGSRRILDVGCDTGRFGCALRAAFGTSEIWGIDLAPPPADRAQPYDRRIVGSFPDDLPQAKFDCIIFNDVLEHLVDPWDVLSRTRPFLEEGGVVVASIPNVRHSSVLRSLILQGEWRYVNAGILDRTHLRFFTRVTMIELFEQNGFDVARIEPINVRISGKLALLNRLANGRFNDFAAVQYAIVGRRSAL